MIAAMPPQSRGEPMTPSAILQKIRQAFKAQKVDHAQTVRDLVVAIADGKPVDPAHVAELLESAGQTPEHLAQAVELLTTRRCLKKRIEDGEAALRERASLDTAAEKAGAELKAAEEKHERTIGPIWERSRALDAIERGIANARTELDRTCNDPVLLGELESLSQQMLELDARRRPLHSLLVDARNDSERFQARAEQARAAGDAAEDWTLERAQTRGLRGAAVEQQAANACGMRVQELSEQLAELDKEQADLAARQRILALRKLEP
jgi:hypothetical protein